MRKTNKKLIVSTFAVATTLCLSGGVFALAAFQGNTPMAYAETLDHFLIEEKAAVRRAEPNGIRFTTKVNAETKALASALTDVTYGTLLLPEDKLAGEELTFATEDVLNIETSVWTDEETKTEYTSVLAGTQTGTDENGNPVYANLPESYYNRVIVARSYVTGKDKQGNTVTYYTANTAKRSIGYVATMAQIIDNDESELISKIVEKTNFSISFRTTTLSTVKETANALVYNAIENEAAVASVNFGGVNVDASKLAPTYTIANSAVAEVNGETGEITAKGVGSTEITATYTLNGVTKSATATLTVTDEFVGASDYTILVPVGTTSAHYAAPVTYAANELQKLIAEATGVTLAIKEETGNETANGKYIALGGTSLAAASGVAVQNSLKDTASVAKKVGNTLFLCGNTDEGTMYGVYELAGDLLGYEYFAKETYSIAETVAPIAIPANAEYVPDIEYAISPSDEISKNDNLLNRYRMNNWYSDIMVVNGGRIHNTYNILPPFNNMESSETAGNFKSHPKWYTSNVIGTARKYTDAYGRDCPYELCFNARGDANEYALMLSTAVKAYTDALTADKTLTKASLSIRDNVIWCECSACRKETATDAALGFLNDVCAGIRAWMQENNDPRVDTFRMIFLAYYTTGAAPTAVTTLDKYVDIWFAESFAVYTLPMNDTSAKGETKTAWTNLQAWAELLDQSQNCTNGVRNNELLVWTYNSNMFELLAPYDSFTSMRVNYGLFSGLGVDSVYNYTDSAMSAWSGLKKYLASKLTWNANPSDEEWNAWIDAFFVNAYGEGASEMKAWFTEYLTYAQTINSKFNVAHNISGDTVSASIYLNVATEEFFSKTALETWLNHAESALNALDANDPKYQVYYDNIALERLSPIYLLLEIYGDELNNATKVSYAATFCGEAVALGVEKTGHVVSISETLAKYDALLVAEKSVAVGVGEQVVASEIFDGGEAIATVMVNGANVYAQDGTLNIATATGVYKAIVTGVRGTRKVVEVHYADKVIRTVSDLDVVKYTGTNITGYYVLGGDIDGNGATIGNAKIGYSQNSGFQGVFDGRGYTISNVKISGNGIFGTLGKATVKNFNLEGITIHGWSASLAGTMYNSTVSNVRIGVSTMHEAAYGLLQGNQMNNNVVWENVTIDATGLVVPNALGQKVYVPAVTFKNVKIIAKSVTTIGMGGVGSNVDENVALELPDGVEIIVGPIIEPAIEETIETEVLTEVGGATFAHASLMAGETVSVTVNGVAVSATAYDGYVTVGDLSGAGMAVGSGNYTAVVTTDDYILTYTNVFYATQIINDLAELAALAPKTNTDSVMGYYVLAGDIDGNGTQLAETVQIWTQNYGFRGTLDGRNHTVSNFNTGNYGIFGNVAYGAVIKDIKFQVNKAFCNVIANNIRAATLNNVEITVNAIAYKGWYAISDEINNSTLTNVTITYAEDVLVDAGECVLCKRYTDTTFTNVVVTTNLQNADKITNSGTPNGVTVNLLGKAPAVEETIETEVLAETSGVTFSHASLTAGENVSVTVNGVAVSATAYDGYVTVGDLSGAGMSVGNGNYTAIVTTDDYILTYTNVFYATQIINDLEELNVVKYTGPADRNAEGAYAITGYYVLGNDIDGNDATFDGATSAWHAGIGFCGTLDGKNHKIYNFRIGNYGIFGNTSGATIKNITLEIYKAGSNVLSANLRSTTVSNVTISVEKILYDTWYSLADQINNSTVTNLTVIYAEGVLVSGDSRIFCKSYTDTTFTNVAIMTNVQNAEHITNSGTPNGVTVDFIGNVPIVQETYTVDTELYAEASNANTVTLQHAAIAAGDSVSVTVNGTTVTATAVAGAVTADISGAGLALGNLYEVVVEKDAYKITYTSVMYVTKAIKEFADLSVVKYTGTNITGYYVLANDIIASGIWGATGDEQYGTTGIYKNITIDGGETAWSQNSGFQGTFDGRGRTIRGMFLVGKGIFGSLGRATITNVTFDNIVLGWDGDNGYVLGRNVYNSEIKDVTINVVGLSMGRAGATWVGVMCNEMNVNVRLTNLTINMNNQSLKWAIAKKANVNGTENTYTNVVVYNSTYTEIIGDQGDGVQSATLPAGITMATK